MNIKSVVATFLTIFVLTGSVFAQEPPPPENKGGQQWFCLKADRAGGHDATLSVYPPGTPGKGSPIPGYPIYVFVKIANKLTTGDPELDKKPEIFSTDQNYQFLSQNYKFNKGEGDGLKGTNPRKDETDFPVGWHDDILPAADHYWYGMQIVEPTGQGVDTGNDLAQKFGTFTFDRLQTDSDCAALHWDPLGFVFDAETLGPIQGVDVTVINAQTGQPVPEGFGTGKVAINPYITLANGAYSFYTDPGFYKLTLGKYNGKQLEIQDPAQVNPNFAQYGYTNLYDLKVNEGRIEEKAGETARVDIAVKTVGAPSPESKIPMLEDVNVGRAGEKISVTGKVTLVPAELVVMYSDPATGVMKAGAEKPEIDETTRRFAFTADQMIDGTFIFAEVQVRKPAVVGKVPSFLQTVVAFFKSFVKDVEAQSPATSVKIDPIPSYLEGIAYDTNGNPLPNVLVGIYLSGSNTPAYQVRSDIEGHYVIGSQYIPTLPYEIRVRKTTGELIRVSTREYLKQNSEFHKANDINSFETIKTESSFNAAGELAVTKEVVDLNEVNEAKKRAAGVNSGGRSTTQPTNNTGTTGGIAAALSQPGGQGIIMVVVAILVLVLIGVGAFVMMKSKQQQTQF